MHAIISPMRAFTSGCIRLSRKGRRCGTWRAWKRPWRKRWPTSASARARRRPRLPRRAGPSRPKRSTKKSAAFSTISAPWSTAFAGASSPAAQPYVHLFATSADIMDSARALCLVEVTRQVILPDLAALERKLISLARAHADTPQMGRTHGQHAVPITFGFAVALYVSRVGQRMAAIRQKQRKTFGASSPEPSGRTTRWRCWRPPSPRTLRRP